MSNSTMAGTFGQLASGTTAATTNIVNDITTKSVVTTEVVSKIQENHILFQMFPEAVKSGAMTIVDGTVMLHGVSFLDVCSFFVLILSLLGILLQMSMNIWKIFKKDKSVEVSTIICDTCKENVALRNEATG